MYPRTRATRHVVGAHGMINNAECTRHSGGRDLWKGQQCPESFGLGLSVIEESAFSRFGDAPMVASPAQVGRLAGIPQHIHA